jgi:hypothetical protein
MKLKIEARSAGATISQRERNTSLSQVERSQLGVE